MQISDLANRFGFYATDNIDLNHDPASATPAFLVCEIEELQAAVRNGLSLPCLLFQTPDFEKDGDGDHPVEHLEGSYIILDRVERNDSPGRLAAYDRCKRISDQLINHMIEDSDEFFDGNVVKTAEGRVGPLTDNLYGWAVNFGFAEAYNGEKDPAKWKGGQP